MLLLILLHALFALTFPLAKIAITNSQPLFFTAIRMIIGGILIIFYQYFSNIKLFRISVRKYLNYNYYIIMLAIFNVFLANAPEYWALKYLTSANACFIYSITPFISALLSYFLFAERITKKKLLGMIIGTAGFIFMLIKTDQVEVKNLTFISWPEINMIIASFATSYGWIIMRQLINKLKIDSQSQNFSDYMLIFLNAASMLTGGLISLGFSFILEDRSNLVNINQSFIFNLIGVILISNIICYNLYAYLLKKYSATLISFIGFIEPIFAAIYGYLLLQETISIRFVLASTIVIAGLYVFYSEDLSLR